VKPSILFINPWIYDFAAYDLWSKPLGLLYLAGYLREWGFHTHLIDCLDVHNLGMTGSLQRVRHSRQPYGTGKFWRERVSKPAALRHVNRPYSRYGISRDLFMDELKKIRKPSAILVTSMMTYWYPGVREVIALSRQIHPGVPVILGGIYARLCTAHATAHCGPDLVVTNCGLDGLDSLVRVLAEIGIKGSGEPDDPRRCPFPAFDLLYSLDYVCLLTSSGCPYRCRYCASRFLNPRFIRRSPHEVLEEILFWHKRHGIRDFAFYDDALLVQSGNHISVLLQEVLDCRLDIRFHTPNALHVREISPELARLLHVSGFRTIRLGLETEDMASHDHLDQKLSEGDFEKAVSYLRRAGYRPEEIGAYILMGLPGQKADSVKDTIKWTIGKGAAPYLAEYSPIPHTALWEEVVSHCAHDLSSEPLFHNNTLMPCWDEGQRSRVPELRRLVWEFRHGRS
jgi:radical SAM superfamily enzyme YgiQ (UPF0313 family)